MERGRHRFRWLSTGLYFTMLAAVPVGPGAAPSPPDLSGTWVLNESLSQDPRGVLREAARKAHAEEGSGGGQRRSGEGGTAAEGDEPAGGPNLGLGAKELHITGIGTALTLAGADGADQRVLYTDGRKTSEEKNGLGKVKTQAQWKDGALEVVTQGPKGRTKTEIFEMTHDRKKLYVLVTLEGYGKMPTVTFRRVYDPEPLPVAAPGPGLPDDDDYDLVEDF
jgi:hypothetical protein